MSAGSLTELVDESSQWGPVDWWRLELRSFSLTPAQRSIAVLAPKEAMSEHRGITPGSFLQGLAYLFSVAAPVIAAAAMVRWVLGDTAYDFPIAFAGTITLVSLLVTGWSEIQRRRHPRASRAAALRMLALIHVIPGAITVLIAQRDAAIGRLAERGLIDPATATRALAAGPGELGLTLAPEVRQRDPEVPQGGSPASR